MDLKLIADALAARYLTLSTPTGAEALRTSHGQAPHGPMPTPFVVVMPQQGSIVINPGPTMEGEHELEVLIYFSKAPGDLTRVETQRQLWLGTLLTATFGQAQLGLGPTVLKGLPTDWEFTELPYGGDMYDGIRITVRVWTSETVTLTP